MSRTIRRKEVQKSWRYRECSYTHETDTEHAELHGGWKTYIHYYTKELIQYHNDVAYCGRKLIPKEGKEYKKGWWEYHNDTLRCFSDGKGPGYFMTSLQRIYRRDAEREIQKYFDDEEYEVQILTKAKRLWWD